MIKECKLHGYFRSENCPQCGEKGKLLIHTREVERIGRIMAGSLRHFPDLYEITIDKHGWADIEKLVEGIKRYERDLHWLKVKHIAAIVKTDPKGRYQIREKKIRATYGHTIDIDLDLPVDDIPSELYYPTTPEEVDIILETGLKPSDRKMVHLSKTVENAIEAGLTRAENPIILKIDTQKAIQNGVVIKRAGTTVYITDEIPPQFLSKSE